MAASPPTVLQLPADHSTDRLGQVPVAIIIHGTGGTDSRNTLQHGDGRGVSIHALIVKSGTIYRMVPDERGANHAGAASSSFRIGTRIFSGGAVNRATLGIELENLQNGKDPYTDQQLLSMGWEINRMRAKYGPLPIKRHAELDPTRRRDPYQLSTEQIEKWANAATLVYDPPVSLPTKRYRVKRRYVTQRKEDNGPPFVRELVSGEVVEVDAWYTNNRVHFASGEGFGDLADLEAI
jgi:N-acetyl-anhydromuramyl-L-alanine amidase AmpD